MLNGYRSLTINITFIVCDCQYTFIITTIIYLLTFPIQLEMINFVATQTGVINMLTMKLSIIEERK